MVQGGDRLGYVEGLGVGGGHGRNQSDVPGQRCDAGGGEHRVQPPADLVRAPVGPFRRGGLEGEGVLEGDEVQQSGLGFGDGIGPVAGREEFAGPGARLAPGGRVPARAVERDGEVQRFGKC